MAAKSRSDLSASDIPIVGPREPCPCGSGKRYKACHGKHRRTSITAAPPRPFEGLPGECDWVAMREIVPAGTASVRLGGEHADRSVTVATVLPLAVAAVVRQGGEILLGLQTAVGSDDPSRDLGRALEEALRAEPGSSIPAVSQPGPGNRLQDLLDLDAPFEVTVHDTFDFWVDDPAQVTPDVTASLEQANAMVAPTVRLTSVDAGYWCRVSDRDQLRWVLPHEEERLLDSLARLHAAGDDGVGEGSRLLGTFRAYGLLVPVWDLPEGTSAAEVEEPARAFADRLASAFEETTPLSSNERRARAGLANRQITLR